MDTTPEYVKMSQQALEIQGENANFREGDWLWNGTKALCIGSDVWGITRTGTESRDVFIPRKLATRLGVMELVDQTDVVPIQEFVFQHATYWEPTKLYRQDQLQEMFGVGKIHVPFLELERYHTWASSVNDLDYWDSFKSMEQLWLSFVMYGKHKKTWDTGKEDWVD